MTTQYKRTLKNNTSGFFYFMMLECLDWLWCNQEVQGSRMTKDQCWNNRTQIQNMSGSTRWDILARTHAKFKNKQKNKVPKTQEAILYYKSRARNKKHKNTLFLYIFPVWTNELWTYLYSAYLANAKELVNHRSQRSSTIYRYANQT